MTDAQIWGLAACGFFAAAGWTTMSARDHAARMKRWDAEPDRWNWAPAVYWAAVGAVAVVMCYRNGGFE